LKSNAIIILYTGNVYIADTGNQRIRFVSATTGIISTIVGDGNRDYNGDGIAATSASLYYPLGVALDSSGKHTYLTRILLEIGYFL
jgi:DNA-binding beta-propeller fold protein YncE